MIKIFGRNSFKTIHPLTETSVITICILKKQIGMIVSAFTCVSILLSGCGTTKTNETSKTETVQKTKDVRELVWSSLSQAEKDEVGTKRGKESLFVFALKATISTKTAIKKDKPSDLIRFVYV